MRPRSWRNETRGPGTSLVSTRNPAGTEIDTSIDCSPRRAGRSTAILQSFIALLPGRTWRRPTAFDRPFHRTSPSPAGRREAVNRRHPCLPARDRQQPDHRNRRSPRGAAAPCQRRLALAVVARSIRTSTLVLASACRPSRSHTHRAEHRCLCLEGRARPGRRAQCWVIVQFGRPGPASDRRDRPIRTTRPSAA